jgi:hypothetical protein
VFDRDKGLVFEKLKKGHMLICNDLGQNAVGRFETNNLIFILGEKKRGDIWHAQEIVRLNIMMAIGMSAAVVERETTHSHLTHPNHEIKTATAKQTEL